MRWWHSCQLVFPCVDRKVSQCCYNLTSDNIHQTIIHPWWDDVIRAGGKLPTWSTNGFAFVGWPNWDWVRWAVSRKQTPVVSNLFISVTGCCYTCHYVMISQCWHNSQCLTCLRRCWLFPGLFTNEWAGNQLVARARSACAHWAVVISVLCNNWDWAGSLALTMPSSSLVTTTHQAFISGLSWETLPFRLKIPKN